MRLKNILSLSIFVAVISCGRASYASEAPDCYDFNKNSNIISVCAVTNNHVCVISSKGGVSCFNIH